MSVITPDRNAGPREEEEVQFEDRAADGDPTVDGAVRFRSDIDNGVLRLKTSTGVKTIPTTPGAPGPHAATHIRNGSDEIDGDRVDIDFDPSDPTGVQAVDYGYTPDTSADEVDNAEHLTSHLQGLNKKWIDFLLENDPPSGVDYAFVKASGKVTDEDWTRTGGNLLKSVDYTYDGQRVSTEVTKVYAEDGTSTVGQTTETWDYTDPNLPTSQTVRDV